MLIGFDGRSLLAEKTGIGVYTDRLFKELLANDKTVRCKLYLPIAVKELLAGGETRRALLHKLASDPEGRAAAVTTFLPPKLQRWLWGKWEFPSIETYLGPIDLFHGTLFIMPPLKKAKGVLTVYDLTFMLFPEYHAKGMQAFTRDIKRYVSRADCIIAISEHTKRDIVRVLGVPEERVRVTLLAADERYRVLEDKAAVASVVAKYGIDREYILYTGTLEPRKNIPAIIRGFHAVKGEMNIPHRLVLAGKKGWLYDQIFAEVQALGMEQDVIFTGYVPDEDLPYLYNGADLFVYPSFYEGFGLPPLEAMACGCPVVTSNVSSLPEVVGEAGIMVDPQRPEELSAAMERVLDDTALAAKMRADGIARAATFSWDRCARETLAAYRDVVGR